MLSFSPFEFENKQKQATEGHDDVVEFSGLEFADSVDGIKGEDWVTIPPPLSWFKDDAKK